MLKYNCDLHVFPLNDVKDTHHNLGQSHPDKQHFEKDRRGKHFAINLFSDVVCIQE